ncbi:MAG: iron chelate uptake ABC transporter family permease subunit [bacterium]|nr:iron chelate uptake ABC transporter family permease subunit [bacterium]
MAEVRISDDDSRTSRTHPTLGVGGGAVPGGGGVRPGQWRMVALIGGVVLASLAFLLLGTQGRPDLLVPMRLERLAPIVVVGIAVAVSSVAFQTVTANRILTPSIMGLDALYALIQTVAIWGFGSAAVGATDPILRFVFETAALVGFAALLYRVVLGRMGRSVYLLVLIGIVLGTLFRSASTFFQRVIDPNEYLIVVDRMFASFSGVDARLLLAAALLTGAGCAYLWHVRHELDVLTLGRDNAVALGISHRQLTSRVLLACTLLVGAATALVGPITFLGLLVANLTYSVASSQRHSTLLPTAALLGVLLLVGGQAILERILGMGTVVAVVVEFVGGILFLFLLARGKA